MPARACPSKAALCLEEDLRAAWFLEHLPSVDSTNLELLRRLRAGSVTHGQILLSDYQSRGRGQFDRQWECPPGSGLLLSWLWKLETPGKRLSLLSPLCALACVDALRTLGVDLCWKWPNDLMLALPSGAAKVGGILIQTQLRGDLCYAVCGLGLNLLQKNMPVGLRQSACSLLSAGVPPPSRNEILNALLRALQDRLQLLDNPVALFVALQAVDVARAQEVLLLRADSTHPCEVLGYTDTGGVQVRDTDGVSVYHAGEIHLIPKRED